MPRTLSPWKRRLFGFPKRIDCPKMELIGRDHEGISIYGPGYIEILDNENMRFCIYGAADDLTETVKKIRRTTEHPYEALEQFRLIATDYSGIEWAGGYTVVRFFADVEGGFPLTGSLQGLSALDQSENVDPESSVELVFSPIPDLPMTTERVTTVEMNGEVLGKSYSAGKQTLSVLGAELEFEVDPADDALYVRANTSKHLSHPYLENWLAEPLRILLGGPIYPRLIARNIKPNRAHIQLRVAPRGKLPSPVGLAARSKGMLYDPVLFWAAYKLILEAIAHGEGFEAHELTSLYTEVSGATLGSEWVLSMTLASTVEALGKRLMTDEDRRSSYKAEDLKDMNAYLKKWTGCTNIRDRLMSSLGMLKHRNAAVFIKGLSGQEGITDAQLDTWKTVRNSVMHGELIEPWAQEENERRLNELIDLVHALTWLVLKATVTEAGAPS